MWTKLRLYSTSLLSPRVHMTTDSHTAYPQTRERLKAVLHVFDITGKATENSHSGTGHPAAPKNIVLYFRPLIFCPLARSAWASPVRRFWVLGVHLSTISLDPAIHTFYTETSAWWVSVGDRQTKSSPYAHISRDVASWAALCGLRD